MFCPSIPPQLTETLPECLVELRGSMLGQIPYPGNPYGRLSVGGQPRRLKLEGDGDDDPDRSEGAVAQRRDVQAGSSKNTSEHGLMSGVVNRASLSERGGSEAPGAHRHRPEPAALPPRTP